jgi:hypothetical protein
MWVCLSNNVAERGFRGIALGPAAAMYSLIVTAKLNGVDPQAWLTHPGSPSGLPNSSV